MSEQVGDLVTVPNVVGLPFHVGRDLAREHGVTLANPDPDGPPVGALAWPGLFSITSQRPEPGAVVTRHSSVAVEITEHGDAQQPAPTAEPSDPPRDSARADAPSGPRHL
ncbi:PASTA domain-containing protein [Microbacterium sp. P06]|uniref:PASTA domain-containing protein n=1 Tax=unclassified Microbacterium TaxID=2609290 RepID=UPI00374623FA